MIPSTARGSPSLVQETDVAGPPVEVQTKVCDDVSYMRLEILTVPVVIIPICDFCNSAYNSKDSPSSNDA